MGHAFIGLVEIGARVPAAGKLLDGGHVDHAVVQGTIEPGHIGADERAISGDGIAGQGSGVLRIAVFVDERKHGIFGLADGGGGLADFFIQPGTGMHLGDEGIHLCQLLLGGVDDQIDAFSQDVEIAIGDDGGDLDDDMALGVQAGHFQIDPNEAVVLCGNVGMWHAAHSTPACFYPCMGYEPGCPGGAITTGQRRLSVSVAPYCIKLFGDLAHSLM